MRQSDIEEEYIFADEGPDSPEEPVSHAVKPWKVLIVDDEEEIHTVTVLALSGLTILGRELLFDHAYSAAEALEVLTQQNDFAVVILDVVMENDEAGLDVARKIRDDMHLTELRIILRTGQPGYAPEERIIKEYDINDYKTKTELTRSRLITTLFSAIRSYDQIVTINESRRAMEQIAQLSSHLMCKRTLSEFCETVIQQIAMILHLDSNGLICARYTGSAASQEVISRDLIVRGATGIYSSMQQLKLEQLDDDRVINQVTTCLNREEHIYGDTDICFYLGGNAFCAAVYIASNRHLTELEGNLIEVLLTNVSVGFENINLLQQLRVAAFQDTLTSLPNRTEFINILNHFRRGHVPGNVVVLLDLAGFSDINDGLGQEVGNLLLISVADRLRDELPDSVTISRVSADVFGMIGFDTELNEERMKNIFEFPFRAGEHLIPLDVNIGARKDVDAQSSGLVLFKQTYIALNHAKRNAQHNFVFYVPEMEEETTWRLGIVRQLRNDFQQDKLQLWYQPQIDLQKGSIIGMEALLRWPSENGHFVPPDTFIPLAENSGLIIGIGYWVIEQACKTLHRMQKEFGFMVRIAVNVSVSQFRHANFVDDVLKILAEYQVPPDMIELEITESVLMDQPTRVVDALNKLKEKGVCIALDDFGTGFSSLSYLRQLPLDRLKIDRHFISEISSSEGALFVDTIIELGHKLGLIIVAEGIETAQQEDYLKQLSCQEGQGYKYYKPQPVEQVIPLLVQH